MNQKRVSWPQAVVIIAIIAAVVVLAILRRDIASFVTLGVAVVGALGLGAGQLSTIKDQVNGNLSRILDMFETHVNMLAAAHVPQSALPGQQAGPETAVPPAEASPGTGSPPVAGGTAT